MANSAIHFCVNVRGMNEVKNFLKRFIRYLVVLMKQYSLV